MRDWGSGGEGSGGGGERGERGARALRGESGMGDEIMRWARWARWTRCTSETWWATAAELHLAYWYWWYVPTPNVPTSRTSRTSCTSRTSHTSRTNGRSPTPTPTLVTLRPLERRAARASEMAIGHPFLLLLSVANSPTCLTGLVWDKLGPPRRIHGSLAQLPPPFLFLGAHPQQRGTLAQPSDSDLTILKAL
jgi:hypothetical protein